MSKVLCRIFGHRWVCQPCGEPIDSECRGRGLLCDRCGKERPPLPPNALPNLEHFAREIWRHVRNCNSCTSGTLLYGKCEWMEQLYASIDELGQHRAARVAGWKPTSGRRG